MFVLFLFLIRSFANGVGTFLVKETHCGRKSLGKSLGRKKGVGGQEW